MPQPTHRPTPTIRYLPAGLRLAAWLIRERIRIATHRGAHRVGPAR